MALKTSNKCDYMAKVIVLGNSSVGKTSILTRYTWTGEPNQFNLSHTPTIGLDFKTKTINYEGKLVKLQLWDTAGQERFRTITDNYYSGVSGIVLVYSVSDRRSFQEIEDWMVKVISKAGEDVPKIILGNKCEISRTSNGTQNRYVQKHEGQLLAHNHKCMFMEVSAKQNINIDQAFIMLINKIMRTMKMGENQSNVLVLDKKKYKQNISKNKEGKCCN